MALGARSRILPQVIKVATHVHLIRVNVIVPPTLKEFGRDQRRAPVALDRLPEDLEAVLGVWKVVGVVGFGFVVFWVEGDA